MATDSSGYSMAVWVLRFAACQLLIPSFLLLWSCPGFSQSRETVLDPDSLINELIDTGDWEDLSLHPEIMDEYLNSRFGFGLTDKTVAANDSLKSRITDERTLLLAKSQQVFSVNIPSGTFGNPSDFNWNGLLSGDSPVPVSLRYRLKLSGNGNWEARFLADQDAGEPLRTKSFPGVPDHLSGGVIIRNDGLLREAILGDFQVNAGFGAVIASSPVFSASLGDPALLNRTGKGIRLHPGTDENRHFRGIAGRFSFGSSEAMIFLSDKKVDAALDTVRLEESGGKMAVVDHFYNTGYHKTISEISARETLKENAGGLVLKTRGLNYEAGVNAAVFRYALPLNRADKWETVFANEINQFSRLGVWAQYRLRFGIIFCETGWSPGRSIRKSTSEYETDKPVRPSLSIPALIAGFRLFEVNGFSMAFRIMSVSPYYPVWYSFFQSGTGFSRGTNDLSWMYRLSRGRNLEFCGSLLVRQDQWPGSGRQFPWASARMAQQMRVKLKSGWMISGMAVAVFENDTDSLPQKVTVKFQADSDPDQLSRLRLRVGLQEQLSGFGSELVSGLTGDMNCSIRMLDDRLRLISGFRIFNVTTGMDPLYAYEPDMLFGWSAPVMSGSGTRWFLNLRFMVLPGLVIEGKVYQSSYTDFKHLQEGNNGGLGAKVQVIWTRKN